MEHIGVDQAPISQTPSQALRSGFGIFNYIMSIICTYWVNFGFAVLVIMKNDRIALWSSPGIVVIEGARVYYISSSIWSDFLWTCIFVTFFTALVSTPGLRKSVIQAKTLPIPAQELRPYRFLGVTITHTFGRCVVFTLVALATIFPLTVGFVAAACDNGSMPIWGDANHENQCYLEASKYKWIKAGWCSMIALIMYPFIFLSALNRDSLTQEEYAEFLTANSAKTNMVVGTADSAHHQEPTAYVV